MRSKYLGDHWGVAKVRGTPNNTGDGLKMAMDLGAALMDNLVLVMQHQWIFT